MPGVRLKQSVEARLLDGDKNCSSDILEIMERQRLTIGTVEGASAMPKKVGSDPSAAAHWRWVFEQYGDGPWATTADRALIARYCLSYAEYLRLYEELHLWIDVRPVDKEAPIGDAYLEWIKTWHSFLRILHTIETDLLSMEDRLLLNPKIRLSALPVPDNKKVEESASVDELGFEV